MRAVVLAGTGGVEVLRFGERPDPVPGPGEILLRVRATALNRADLLQRRGRYPPPPGAPDILGLEAAGDVAESHRRMEANANAGKIVLRVGR